MLLACAPQASSQAAPAAKGAPTAKAGPSLDWDSTFADHSGARPLHFVAEYVEPNGTHRLEEWRTGQTHLRRRTDDRIDLHADATSKPTQALGVQYLWQIIDVQKKIDNRISSGAMFRAGLFYNYYAMAHVLTRPAGRFRLVALSGEPAAALPGHACRWFELTPDGQAASRICWSEELGIPLEMRTPLAGGGGTVTFRVRSVDRDPIPAATFAVQTAGLAVRDHDKMVEDD